MYLSVSTFEYVSTMPLQYRQSPEEGVGSPGARTTDSRCKGKYLLGTHPHPQTTFSHRGDLFAPEGQRAWIGDKE